MDKKKVIKEWVESIVIAAALAIFVRTFFFQIYKIPTESMVPVLTPGDKIFVSKLVYGPKVPFTSLRFPGFSNPKRGQVVVFVPPHDRGKVYIKRLVGLGGERVYLENGNVFINGKIIIDPLIAKNNYTHRGQYGSEEITIPEGHYFFLGDNSINSSDSRDWGYVAQEDVVGKSIFIWWPPRRIGMIE